MHPEATPPLGCLSPRRLCCDDAGASRPLPSGEGSGVRADTASLVIVRTLTPRPLPPPKGEGERSPCHCMTVECVRHEHRHVSRPLSDHGESVSG
jgi:hypothetical protein